MTGFPALEPELRERLLLDPAAFDAFLFEYLGAIPARDYGPQQLEFALTYPWARPESSYLLSSDGEVGEPDLDRAQGRHPILAFGSNAAPSTLRRKFAHFEDPADREILVLAGDLHDYDVGPAASVAIYGAMPATLFASPGTAVRAAVLFATDNQATQLTWSELTYVFGRLDVRFSAELEVTTVLAYASRFGTFCPDGEPLALAAVRADRPDRRPAHPARAARHRGPPHRVGRRRGGRRGGLRGLRGLRRQAARPPPAAGAAVQRGGLDAVRALRDRRTRPRPIRTGRGTRIRSLRFSGTRGVRPCEAAARSVATRSGGSSVNSRGW